MSPSTAANVTLMLARASISEGSPQGSPTGPTTAPAVQPMTMVIDGILCLMVSNMVSYRYADASYSEDVKKIATLYLLLAGSFADAVVTISVIASYKSGLVDTTDFHGRLVLAVGADVLAEVGAFDNIVVDCGLLRDCCCWNCATDDERADWRP